MGNNETTMGYDNAHDLMKMGENTIVRVAMK